MNSRALPFADACERNKQPILDALLRVLPNDGRVLEIGSGTGQHVVFFARHMPEWQWQPTDQPENLQGLAARIRAEGSANIASPIELDVLKHGWPRGPFTAVFSANTAHIMGWPAVEAMFEGVASVLEDNGNFCLYGPFSVDGRHTAPSNAAFDRQLRERDLSMGVRDTADLETLASRLQMNFEMRLPMPANNLLLVLRRAARG